MSDNRDVSSVGEHLATFSQERHHVVSDGENFYVYAKKRRPASAVRDNRLELLSERLKDLNERNREFWAKKQK